MARRIFVLRHGETLFNSEKKLQGHCNSPLTSKGIAQAKSAGLTLRKYLTEGQFNVYSSPLGRALQTAYIVCKKIRYAEQKIVKDPRLKEFSLGDWEHRTITSLVNEFPDLLSKNDWYLMAPQSESYEMVKERLISWLSDIPEKDVVVVCHGLTGCVLRGILLGLSYEDVWKQDLPQDAFFIVENSSIKRVKYPIKKIVA